MTRTDVRPDAPKSRSRSAGVCTACGAQTPRWVGRCPECGDWGSVVEVEVQKKSNGPVLPASAVAICDVDRAKTPRMRTGIGELDRVLCGGLVPGSVTLLGGEPGMGKSTLTLAMLGRMAEAGMKVLLVSAEESLAQVRLRAERLDVVHPDLTVTTESSIDRLGDLVSRTNPDVLVVDSIQTVSDPESTGVPGSMTQVRDCAQVLVRLAKDREMATVLVGHVTKDGNLAGPRLLEHVADTVLYFEGDRHHSLRMLRALKHRFGATDDLGLFEMTKSGLVDVGDPSALLLADRCEGLPGTIVAPILDGSRPLLVEIQALLCETIYTMLRRSAQAFDTGRLTMLAAIMGARLGLGLASQDIYASVAGGIKANDTGADLAMVIAMASALQERALPADLVALGEIGLGGEVRAVPQVQRRLNEAARLGFRTAVVPTSTPDIAGIELIRVNSAKATLAALFA